MQNHQHLHKGAMIQALFLPAGKKLVFWSTVFKGFQNQI